MKTYCCAAPEPVAHPRGGTCCAACHAWVLGHGDALAEVYRLVGATAALRDALEALLAALPRCDRCDEVATHAYARGRERWCWNHAPSDCPPYPRSVPVQRAITLLAYLPDEDG